MKSKTIGTLLMAGLVVISAMVVFAGTAAAETFTETLYSDDPQQSNEVTFEFTEETTIGHGKILKLPQEQQDMIQKDITAGVERGISQNSPGNSLLYTEAKKVEQCCYNYPWWLGGKQDAVYAHNFDVMNLHTIYSSQITIWASDVNTGLGEKPAVYVNGNYIGDLKGASVLIYPHVRSTKLSIDPCYVNPGINEIKIVDNRGGPFDGFSCYIWASKLEIEYDTEQSIPEFASIAIPAVAVLGLFLYFNKRKHKKD